MLPCPYFGKCGGCSFQHIPYDAQLKNKKKLLANELKDLSSEVRVEIFSGRPYHYRNRMDFVFSSEGPGLRMRGRYDKIVSIRRCEISNDKLNKLLNEVWKWFDLNKDEIEPFDVKKGIGTLRYSLIRAPEFSNTSAVSFVLNSDSKNQEKHIKLIREFAKTTSATSVVIAKVHSKTDVSVSDSFFPVKGEAVINEILSGKNFIFHTQGFFQNNSSMTESMVLYITKQVTKYQPADSSLIDLYGGVGTFGVSVASMFRDCLIIESSKISVECAKMNIMNNNLTNTDVVCIDASKIKDIELEKRITGEELFVIADPPRSGIHPKTLKYLAKLKPVVIFYVSCNPKQMKRDISVLNEEYKISSLAMFDMFPQTRHIEAIATLELR